MDISSLRERSFSDAISVSALNVYIKNMFDSDRYLRSVTVRGEITDFKHHSSGHMYFRLKDSESVIDAAMFRSAAYGLKFKPENGMRVTVRGSVSVYAASGKYQIYVSNMVPDGIGELYLAFERLKSRLAEEGLFDAAHKKPIPRFPERVGVITSPTGAAIRDIVNVTTRRMPSVKLYLYPSSVQGMEAEGQLIRALDYFDRSDLVDVVIIGRGGGSIEDLWCFNSEKLARRIYDCRVPIISAVGHETDFTVCDLVSDLRAPTPSGGAELAVPNSAELLRRVGLAADRARGSLSRSLDVSKQMLAQLKERRGIKEPYSFVEARRAVLADDIAELERSYKIRLEKMRSRLAALSGNACALNPLAVLSRGYSVVERQGRAISSTAGIFVGDALSIRTTDGRIETAVISVDPDKGEREKVKTDG